MIYYFLSFIFGIGMSMLFVIALEKMSK